jgi:DNA-binding transcriptional ArsR family regulator
MNPDKDHLRRQILHLLRKNESMGYNELIEALDADQSTIEKVIDDLRSASKIEEHRPGSLKLQESPS